MTRTKMVKHTKSIKMANDGNEYKGMYAITYLSEKTLDKYEQSYTLLISLDKSDIKLIKNGTSDTITYGNIEDAEDCLEAKIVF